MSTNRHNQLQVKQAKVVYFIIYIQYVGRMLHKHAMEGLKQSKALKDLF